ncbi:MAG: hypothetical protein EOM88_03720 [Clostridia bacterium]|nr:hypothetical protein [Clostridia bacterium]
MRRLSKSTKKSKHDKIFIIIGLVLIIAIIFVTILLNSQDKGDEINSAHDSNFRRLDLDPNEDLTDIFLDNNRQVD